MKDEYNKLIAEMDKTLSLIKKQWEAAKPGKDKNDYEERLNATLDERFRLMGLRDTPVKKVKVAK